MAQICARCRNACLALNFKLKALKRGGDRLGCTARRASACCFAHAERQERALRVFSSAEELRTRLCSCWPQQIAQVEILVDDPQPAAAAAALREPAKDAHPGAGSLVVLGLPPPHLSSADRAAAPVAECVALRVCGGPERPATGTARAACMGWPAGSAAALRTRARRLHAGHLGCCRRLHGVPSWRVFILVQFSNMPRHASEIA